MKKLSVLLLTLLCTNFAFAQSKFVGIWEGALLVADNKVRLVFYITETNGKLSCKMDSPDQGQTSIPCTKIDYKGDSIWFEIGSAGISYNGKLTSYQLIDGQFAQSVYTIALPLEKTNTPTQLLRPQTPKPPFSYKIEDVTYYNADKTIKFGGTITIPSGTGSFPAILLISGSGQQNRDEEIYGHKPFAVMADYLTKQGYVVLRVDDRGVGSTTGDVQNATTADFVKDASASLNYLATRKEANKNKLGIIGHSEGGQIATMLAAERKDINFIVSLAGPGVPIVELMEEQSVAVFQSNGADSAFVSHYRTLYRGIIASINAAKDSNDAAIRIQESINQWKKGVSPQTVMDMGLVSPKSESEYIQAYVNIYNNKWYNYFLHSNPQPYIEKLSCKVLVLNGEKDIQVLPATNLEGFRKSLKKSSSKKYDVKELKGLNHLFQTCNECHTGEYSTLDETLSPSLLTELSTWLNTNVK